MSRRQKIYLPFKRIIDLFGSIIGIVFCAALFWWWIIPVNTIATKGHPFFVQERYGKNKSIFKLLKFRSMNINANPNLPSYEINGTSRDEMETGFGRFLRKTSLDETLQLFNIFIGQMSFIGPRPGSAHNEEYLRKCREEYSPSAFDVKPGISGYAQIKMKRQHDPDFKAYWDHRYVERMSLFFDAGIFIYTILKLFGAVKGR